MKGIDIKADKNRTLRFTINSMIQFKKERKKDFTAALSSLEKDFDLELVRYLFYLGLKWEDKELTEETAGDIMDIVIEEMGFDGLATTLVEAIQKALGVKQTAGPNPNQVSH